jgi:nicotinamidase-related amidase
MKEMGMGNDRYHLIDVDHEDREVTAAQAVADIAPGWVPDEYNTFAGRNPIKIKSPDERSQEEKAEEEKAAQNEAEDVRKLLIVVDMQNDFIDGSLGTKEAEAIVENVKNKIRNYAAEDIFVTMDTHEADYLDSQEGKNLPVEHCIKGTAGWEIREDIKDLLGDAKIVEKPTFGSMDLACQISEIAENENIEIELVGLCTDICVVSNALLLKAAMPEVKISVDSSCCAGVTPDNHEAALTTMKSCQIEVM